MIEIALAFLTEKCCTAENVITLRCEACRKVSGSRSFVRVFLRLICLHSVAISPVFDDPANIEGPWP